MRGKIPPSKAVLFLYHNRFPDPAWVKLWSDAAAYSQNRLYDLFYILLVLLAVCSIVLTFNPACFLTQLLSPFLGVTSGVCFLRQFQPAGAAIETMIPFFPASSAHTAFPADVFAEYFDQFQRVLPAFLLQSFTHIF